MVSQGISTHRGACATLQAKLPLTGLKVLDILGDPTTHVDSEEM
jgi:hypothetical protein